MMNESFSENETFPGEPANLVYAFAAPAGLIPGEQGVVFAACSSGMMKSEDGGRTWSDALAELSLTEPVPVIALVVSPDYGRDGRAFGGAPGGVFYSAGSPPTWKAVLFPPPPPTVSSLAISPDFERDQTLFAGTMEDGVFISRDNGEGWVAWNFGLLDLNVMCLAISPAFAEDETIFAGTESGIFRSTNGGRAWREVELPFGFEAVLSLAFSPQYAQDQTLYAGTEGQGLWISTDEGETWTRLGEDVIEDPVNSIQVSADGLLAVTSAALWHSTDGGDTWTNRLPEAYEGRELSAFLVPASFGPGAKGLAGFTDGAIEALDLA